ncbi:MAG: hypothetical protein M3O92_02915 [Actinomycetota bacterium]|nr:hypothetical protein [Actinomycetota bacterium]
MSSAEAIHVETADAASAAYLMQELFTRFPAKLVQSDQGTWEIVVEAGMDPPRRLSDLLAVVQEWIDGGDGHVATIRVGKRTHALGLRSADLPLTREAGLLPARRRRATPPARV